MSDRTPFLTYVLALLWLPLAGCDQPVPTGLADDYAPAMARVEARHGEPGEELPLHIEAGAVLLAQNRHPDFGPPTFGKGDFDGRCSRPSDFVISFQLDGQASHFGLFAGRVEHCTQVDFQAGNVTTSDGILVFTAANGDELWGTYQGEPSGAGTAEHMVFDGGTGRFASASGGGIGLADCDQAAGTCVFVLDGVIAYDASDRAR
jgi:hypothetical protein